MVGRKCSSKKKTEKKVFVLSLTAHYSLRHLSFPRAKATSKPFFVCVFYRTLFVRNSSFNVLMCLFAVETNDSRYSNRNLVSQSKTREEKASVENGKGGKDKARDSCRYSMN